MKLVRSRVSVVLDTNVSASGALVHMTMLNAVAIVVDNSVHLLHENRAVLKLDWRSSETILAKHLLLQVTGSSWLIDIIRLR